MKIKRIGWWLLFLSFGVMLPSQVLASESIGLKAKAHVQNIGWMPWKSEPVEIGTTGQGKQVEGLIIQTQDDRLSQELTYQVHVQNIGWMPKVQAGQLAGTVGKNLRIEGIRIELPADLAKEYEVTYQAHVQNIGWMPIKQVGQLAGTTGQGLRMEAIRIQIEPVNLLEKQLPVIEAQPTTMEVTDDISAVDWLVTGTDEFGEPLSLESIQIDTTKVNTQVPGSYPVTFSYQQVQVTSYVTVTQALFQMNHVQQIMLKLINDYRLEQGEELLTYRPALDEGTSIRSQEIVSLYQHVRPNGLGFQTAFSGLRPEEVLGENLAIIHYQPNMTEQQIAETFFQVWQSSPSHNQNMLLSDYETFSCYVILGQYYQTQVLYGVQWFSSIGIE